MGKNDPFTWAIRYMTWILHRCNDPSNSLLPSHIWWHGGDGRRHKAPGSVRFPRNPGAIPVGSVRSSLKSVLIWNCYSIWVGSEGKQALNNLSSPPIAWKENRPPTPWILSSRIKWPNCFFSFSKSDPTGFRSLDPWPGSIQVGLIHLRPDEA